MANKIVLKKSSVGSKVPTTSDLEYGELALNYADGKLYYKTSLNTIGSFVDAGGSSSDTFKNIAVSGQSTVVADSPTDTLTLVGTADLGITTDATTDSITFSLLNTAVAAGSYGSQTQIPIITVDAKGRITAVSTTTVRVPAGAIFNADINDSAGIAVSKLAASTISGVALGNNLNNLTISSGLSGTSYNGSAAVTIALATAYGDTVNPYGSKTAKYVLAAPNGAAGAPTFRALVASDIPTLNQNTTGKASNVTGIVAIANGGTGATTRQGAMNALAGSTTAGYYLRGNGTNVVMSDIQASDIPTLNQNTTGSAATFTSTTQNSQFNSIGIGTAASGTAGELRATGSITQNYSDARLKNFEGRIDNALNKVMALNGYYFTENAKAKELGYNNDARQVGVSAQEVEAVLPEIVADAPINSNFEGADYKTVHYDRLVPLLIEAIKEQQKQIEELKSKLGN